MRWCSRVVVALVAAALVFGTDSVRADEPAPFTDFKYTLSPAAGSVAKVPMTIKLATAIATDQFWFVMLDDKFDFSDAVRPASIQCAQGAAKPVQATLVSVGDEYSTVKFPVTAAAAADATVEIACTALYPAAMKEENFQIGAGVYAKDGTTEIAKTLLIAEDTFAPLPKDSFASVSRSVTLSAPYVRAESKVAVAVGPVPANPTADGRITIELPGFEVARGEKGKCTVTAGPAGATCTCTTAGVMTISYSAAAASTVVEASCGARLPAAHTPALGDLAVELYSFGEDGKPVLAARVQGATIPAIDPKEVGTSAALSFAPSVLGAISQLTLEIKAVSTELVAGDTLSIDVPAGTFKAATGDALTCSFWRGDAAADAINMPVTAHFPDGSPEHPDWFEVVVPKDVVIPAGADVVAHFKCGPLVLPLSWPEQTLDVEFIGADQQYKAMSVMETALPAPRARKAEFTMAPHGLGAKATISVLADPFAQKLSAGAVARFTLPAALAVGITAATKCKLAGVTAASVAEVSAGIWEAKIETAPTEDTATLVCTPVELPDEPQGAAVNMKYEIYNAGTGDDAGGPANKDTFDVPAIKPHTFPLLTLELESKQAHFATIMTVSIDELGAFYQDDRFELDLSRAKSLRPDPATPLDCRGPADEKLVGTFITESNILRLDYPTGADIYPTAGRIVFKCPVTTGAPAAATTATASVYRRNSAFDRWAKVGENAGVAFPAISSDSEFGGDVFDVRLPANIAGQASQEGLSEVVFAIRPIPFALAAGARLEITTPWSVAEVTAATEADTCFGTFDDTDVAWAGTRLNMKVSTDVKAKTLAVTFMEPVPLNAYATIRLACGAFIPPQTATASQQGKATLKSRDSAANAAAVMFPPVLAEAPDRSVALATATVELNDDALFGPTAFGAVARVIATKAKLPVGAVEPHTVRALPDRTLELRFATGAPVGMRVAEDVVTRIRTHESDIRNGVVRTIPGFRLNSFAVDAAVLTGQCFNGVNDGAETDIDCGGGVCHGCRFNKHCRENRDCLSGLCEKKSLKCAIPNAAAAFGGYAAALVAAVAAVAGIFLF